MLFKLVSVALCIGGYGLTRAFFARVIARLSRNKNVQPARTAYILKTVNIGLFIAFFSVALLTIGLGYGDVSVFVSSVFAVIGIALFAQWSILSNLTASLIIFFAFPYRVGHRIRVVDPDEDISGVIEEIEPFHVLIRRANGDLITYPNSLILQKPVIRLDQAPTAKPEPIESD